MGRSISMAMLSLLFSQSLRVSLTDAGVEVMSRVVVAVELEAAICGGDLEGTIKYRRKSSVVELIPVAKRLLVAAG